MKKRPLFHTQSIMADDNPKRSSVSFRGSITVEAAMAVPLFFFAAICLTFLIEICAIQVRIHSGMQYALKKAEQEVYLTNFIAPGTVEQDIVRAIGVERLNRSIVEGGSGGINASGSYLSSDHVIYVKVTYKVRLPFPVFGTHLGEYEDQMMGKGWTGYEGDGIITKKEDVVYVTETGTVYHKDPHCSYLDLSIRGVSSSQVDSLRSEDGSRYYACDCCKGGHASGLVYITGYGNRYHSSLSCSGLKRTIYAVPLSEAVGKGACKKCGN